MTKLNSHLGKLFFVVVIVSFLFISPLFVKDALAACDPTKCNCTVAPINNFGFKCFPEACQFSFNANGTYTCYPPAGTSTLPPPNTPPPTPKPALNVTPGNCDPNQCDCATGKVQLSSCSNPACTVSTYTTAENNNVWHVCANAKTPTTPTGGAETEAKTGDGGAGAGVPGIPNPSEWFKDFNPVPGLSFAPDNDTLAYFREHVVSFAINLLLFLIIVLSLIFLLIGGISWMMAGGNKEGLAKAKGTITYALVGLVIGVISILIVKVIGQVLGFIF